MSTLLELQDVTQRFGGLCAVSNCSLAVEPARTHGIIGPNGAGKTTLFNLITGIYKPSEGRIRFQGKDITGERPNRIAVRGIARTFQNIRLFRNLTVLDNVRTALDSQLRHSPIEALLRLPRHGREEQRSVRDSLTLLEPFGLLDSANALAGELSYGSQRRLEIARALALKPSLLLLDEPGAGVNSSEIGPLIEFLRWLRGHFDVTLVVIEHHMPLVMKLCEHITVLDFGQIIAEGTPDQIRSDTRVIDAYLGTADE